MQEARKVALEGLARRVEEETLRRKIRLVPSSHLGESLPVLSRQAEPSVQDEEIQTPKTPLPRLQTGAIGRVAPTKAPVLLPRYPAPWMLQPSEIYDQDSSELDWDSRYDRIDFAA